MGQVDACQPFDRQDEGAIRRWHLRVIGLTGAVMIAGAVVAFCSVDADAKPQYVTKSKPCGSCHPPNNPPKKK